MDKTAVQRLAGILRLLVLIVFWINILCLLFVPAAVYVIDIGGPGEVMRFLESHNGGLSLLLKNFAACYFLIWSRFWPLVLALFFWVCGTCTASILWQAKRVLDTILEGSPFQLRNAQALNRAAVCCWVISGAALVRLVLWLSFEKNAAPLFTYNTLFIPGFLMAGLLFQVMSALFRQAAELKEDQDLTI